MQRSATIRTERRGRVQAPVILVVLFAIAAGTWIIAQRTSQPSQKEQIDAQKHLNPELFLLKDDDIDKVVVEKGGQKLVLERRGQQWQMTEPLEVRADTSRVNDVIRAVHNLERLPKTAAIIGSKKDPLKLGEYKLDKPEIVATLYKGKTAYGLLVGDETELGGAKAGGDKGVYVKVSDQDVVALVRPRDLDALKKEPKEFRQKQLVTSSRFNADFAQLEWPEQKLVVTKSKDKWRLVEPIADRADQTKVTELIGKVADLKADKDEDFVDDNMSDAAKYGLDKPRLTVEIRRDSIEEEKDDKTKTKTDKTDKAKKKEPVVEKVLIGGPVEGREDRVYAKLADQKNVMAVAASILNDVPKQPNDLRSRDLVELTMGDVDYVRIQRAGSPEIALGKKDFDWEIYQPKGTKADSSSVTDVVKKIDDLEIKEFVDQGDPKEFGLDQPAVTVAVYQKGLKPDDKEKDAKDKAKKDDKKKEEEKTDAASEPKGEPIQVAFGKRDEEKNLTYVRRGDEPTIFAVSTEGLAEILDRDYLAYRRKQVLSFGEPDVAKLSVHRDGKTFSLVRKKDKESDIQETWHMTEPVEAPADSRSASDILFNFTRLNAKKFYAEGSVDLKAYGLDEPKIRATVTLKADGDKEPVQHVLLVGSEADGGGHYAKLGNEDLIFSVEQNVVNYLTSELYDRTLIKFDNFKVEGLTLTWPDAKLELENKKPEGKPVKEWTVVGDDSFKLDVTKTSSLVTYLALLNTDKFVQYQGDFTEEQGLANPALLIEVKIEGDGTPKTLRIGAAAEGEKHYVATAEKSGPVALLPEDRFKDLLAGPNYFAAAEEKKPEPEKPEPAKPEEGKKEESKPEADKKEEKKSDDTKDDKGSSEKEPAKPEEKKPESRPEV